MRLMEPERACNENVANIDENINSVLKCATNKQERVGVRADKSKLQ